MSWRMAFSGQGRGWFRWIWGRRLARSWSYWTPEGQAVVQARQPRQLSKWLTDVGERGASPLLMASIK